MARTRLTNFKILTLSSALILLVISTLNQEVFSFYCTESYCAEVTSEYGRPCPEVNNCTKIGYRTFLDPDVCNCCEYCFDYLHENDTCNTVSPQKPLEMCGPKLTCKLNTEIQKAFCKTMTSRENGNEISDPNFCMAKLYEYEMNQDAGRLGIAEVKPECDSSGNYAPRQCLPGSICYCSNSQGERIFGLATPDVYQDCACARDVAKLQSFGFTGRLPHCLPNGDYDELQCVVRTCHCRAHPEKLFAMHKLNEMECFDKGKHVFDTETPRYYMKDCELRRARIEVQITEAELSGSKMLVGDMPKCDPDGSYANIQTEVNRVYCADPNGIQIELFEAIKFEAAATQMNCFCARARHLLSQSNSVTNKPECCSNGNYRPWQCVGNTCFCVDSLGRQNATAGETRKPEDLDCYPKNVSEEVIDPPCKYE